MFIEAINGMLINVEHIKTIECATDRIADRSEEDIQHHVSPKSADGKLIPSLFVGRGPEGKKEAEAYMEKLKMKLFMQEKILHVD
tara:strand:+ start:106 stop:360 length:255 start_codon:yes stop_codon:yes gene_type:complete